jgi:hypothetical protein
MLDRTHLIGTAKRFLRHRGILMDRYRCSTSPQLRLVRMMAANSIDLVLDVGANNGGHAKMIREAGSRGGILSFEPLPSAHARLAAAAADDSLWAAAPRMCIGEDDGEVTINIAGNSASSSLLPMPTATARPLQSLGASARKRST